MVIVEKYGGTSVDNPEKIQKITKHLKELHEEGKQVIVIVSAASKRTDELLSKARTIDPMVTGRELDMLLSTGESESASLLAISLEKAKIKAISLSAFQIPIIASNDYQQARILKIFKDRITEHLNQNKVVIVPGFQGLTIDGDIVTLGRGGSDTIAVALAKEFDAPCYIYTDVEGVYTIDPKNHPDASLISEIGYDEMLNMALLGGKVLAPMAARLAKTYEVDVIIGSLGKHPQTCLAKEIEARPRVLGIASQDLWEVTIEGFSQELIDDFKELVFIEQVNLLTVKNERGKLTVRYKQSDDNLVKAIIKLLNLFPSSKIKLSQIALVYEPVPTKDNQTQGVIDELSNLSLDFWEVVSENKYLKIIVEEKNKTLIENHFKVFFNLINKTKDDVM
ncbi:MAG TPA: aspartate kinase [Acholeplasmataceae bacterium]|nr:aspartate kinase [Acholeplasmataceae bacterium]